MRETTPQSINNYDFASGFAKPHFCEKLEQSIANFTLPAGLQSPTFGFEFTKLEECDFAN
jgi:hypothetical protein